MRVVTLCTPWVYEVQNILTGDCQKVHVQRLRYYADSSFEVTEEIKLQLKHDGAGFEVETSYNTAKVVVDGNYWYNGLASSQKTIPGNHYSNYMRMYQLW
jgi:hypothetical protein